MQKERFEFWEAVSNVLVEDLVFLDEMGILLGMMRNQGRSKKGTRLYEHDAVYRGKRNTVIGAMTKDKVLTLETFEGSLNGEKFKQFVQEKLAPQLWPGAVLIMYNLSSHKVKGVVELIAGRGASIMYLPAYSPDFNPIEHLWWEIKSFVRIWKPKTCAAVEKLVKIGCYLTSSQTLKNYCIHCCYCPD